jgi:hypothetical protein
MKATRELFVSTIMVNKKVLGSLMWMNLVGAVFVV